MVLVGVTTLGATGCARRRPPPKPVVRDYELAPETPEQRQARVAEDEAPPPPPERPEEQAARMAEFERRHQERDARLREATALETGNVGPDYRGAEGWQDLRWGMTTAEVEEAMKAHRRIDLGRDQFAAEVQLEVLEWAAPIADYEARVTCFVSQGRLAQVRVKLPRITRDDLFGLLAAKYGSAESVRTFDVVWQTPETTIRASWKLNEGAIDYTSRAFRRQLSVVLNEWMRRRANGL